MAHDSHPDEQDKPANNSFPTKTWILLAIIWILCLLPLPLTGTIAMVMNFAAFVMAIVVLAKGYVGNGVFQLLAVFILTPVFYFIGILISAILISQTLDTNNLSKQSLQNILLKSLNKEVADIYKFSGKNNKPHQSTQAPPGVNKPEMKPVEPQQDSQETEKVVTWYIAYTKEGGEIKCSDIVKKDTLLILQTKSGMQVDIHQANILRVERYRTVDNITKKSVWNPDQG